MQRQITMLTSRTLSAGPALPRRGRLQLPPTGRTAALVAMVVAVALFGAACGEDADPVAAEAPTPAPAVEPEPTVEPTVAVVTPAPIAAASFTTEWGCGYGFWVSDADQTVALLVSFVDFEAAAAGNVPATGNIPSVVWSAEVRVGADLMANWCDDVVEPDEPEPVVDETWTVVEGSIDVVGELPVQSIGELVAELTGVVVESPSGERVALEPITIRNGVWGAFAG